MDLETERLVLRTFRPTDGDDLFNYLSLPEIYRFEPGAPLTHGQAHALCLERSRADTFIAVELKAEHILIGHLYFAQTPPMEYASWELGYIFHPRYQCRGYCTEAATRLIRHAFYVMHIHRISAYCDPANTASWRVLEKCGLKKEGFFKEKAFFRTDDAGNPLWHDCLAYGLIARDYASSAQPAPV